MIDVRKQFMSRLDMCANSNSKKAGFLHIALDFVEIYTKVYNVNLNYTSGYNLASSFRRVAADMKKRKNVTTENKLYQHGFLNFSVSMALMYIETAAEGIKDTKSITIDVIREVLVSRYGINFANIPLK